MINVISSRLIPLFSGSVHDHLGGEGQLQELDPDPGNRLGRVQGRVGRLHQPVQDFRLKPEQQQKIFSIFFSHTLDSITI